MPEPNSSNSSNSAGQSERRIELAIMSRPALDGFTPGHIMLAIASSGIGEEAWGFYPEGVKDEVQVGGWQRYTSSTVMPISYAQYQHLKKAIENYKKTNTYQLFGTNCRHFVVTVLREVGIAMEEETLWPNDQGKQYVRMYGEGWGQCLR